MTDRLADRYRNISGTILVINDLNYFEIGINEVIDLSLFSDNFLNKSRGLREHIALKNLIPDESDVAAQQIDPKFFKDRNQFDSNFVKQLAQEVGLQMEQGQTIQNIDSEIIKTIAAEVGREISNNLQKQSISEIDIQKLIEKFSDQNKEVNSDNEYEQNIIDSSIERMQEALEKRYPQTLQKPPQISEDNLDSSDEIISDLKDILNKKGE